MAHTAETSKKWQNAAYAFMGTTLVLGVVAGLSLRENYKAKIWIFKPKADESNPAGRFRGMGRAA